MYFSYWTFFVFERAFNRSDYFPSSWEYLPSLDIFPCKVFAISETKWFLLLRLPAMVSFTSILPQAYQIYFFARMFSPLDICHFRNIPPIFLDWVFFQWSFTIESTVFFLSICFGFRARLYPFQVFPLPNTLPLSPNIYLP